TEVVPPLADAMRFIDRERHRLLARQPARESLQGETLRGHEEEPGLALLDPMADADPLLVREIAVNGGDRIADQLEPGHLIVHERLEGGDDDGQAAMNERRNLVAERLASAGGKNDQGIPSGEGRVDRSFLMRAERFEPPVAPQHALDLGAAESLRYGGDGLVHDVSGTVRLQESLLREKRRQVPSAARGDDPSTPR